MKQVILVLSVLVLLLAIEVCAENYAVLITGDTPDLQAEGIKNWNGEDFSPPTRDVDEFWNDTFIVWEMLWQYGWKMTISSCCMVMDQIGITNHITIGMKQTSIIVTPGG